MNYDDLTIDTFLDKQLQLFPEVVASNREEAMYFLEDVFATVCDTYSDLVEYLEDSMDITGMSKEEILDCSEVFELGDGRYLVVEG